MNAFSEKYNLKRGDVIVLPIFLTEASKHFVLYIGDGYYMENHHIQGVRYLSEKQFNYIHGGKKCRIERLLANDSYRNVVVNRAISLHGSQYHLTNFNCEQFVNLARKGTPQSNQVDTAKGLLTIAGIALLGYALVKSA